MSFACHKKCLMLLTSVRFSLSAVIMMLFFVSCCDYTHCQFGLGLYRPYIKETASELSSLLHTISKYVNKQATREKEPRSPVISGFTRNRNSPAMLNYKMHTPTADVKKIQKASSEILRVTKKLAGIAQQYFGMFFPLPALKKFVENLNFLKKIKPEDVEQVLKNFDISVPSSDETSNANRASLCDSDAIYRLANGSCNNLINPCWGMATQAYARWLPADYGNGVDKPRVRQDGRDLPNPRTLAKTLSPEVDYEDHLTNLSTISTLWGQFITHDILLTPTFVHISGGKQHSAVPDCCGSDRNNAECFPIIVEDGDPFFPKGHCIDLIRSTAHVFNPKGCEEVRLGLPRNQLNQVTSFIDASTVYGSSEQVMRLVREHNGKGSMLKVISTAGAHILPRNNKTCRSFLHGCDNSCLLTGEARATENPWLASLHTLWVREHNRIAKILQRKGWNHETVFQETRKIIIAVIQHITFNEFLPQIIGPAIMKFRGLHTSVSRHVYSHTINPTIMNSFAAAAFRFGHSMIGGRPQATYGNRHSLVRDLFSVDEFCDLSSDPLLRLIGGLSKHRSRKVDNFFARELTNHLFANDTTEAGLDLLSINIQRGRDHGLPSYIHWRKHCGLTPIASFEDLRGTVPHVLLEKLKKIYGSDSVQDMDLYVAGVSEFPLNGASIGPTFACIVAEQFRRLKFGDRFWYENLNHAGAFTQEQLLSIKRTKLSEIICRNVQIPEIQRNVFLINSADNPLVNCYTILQEKSIDWSLW